jgi:hypothetical protein
MYTSSTSNLIGCVFPEHFQLFTDTFRRRTLLNSQAPSLSSARSSLQATIGFRICLLTRHLLDVGARRVVHCRRFTKIATCRGNEFFGGSFLPTKRHKLDLATYPHRHACNKDVAHARRSAGQNLSLGLDVQHFSKFCARRRLGPSRMVLNLGHLGRLRPATHHAQRLHQQQCFGSAFRPAWVHRLASHFLGL